jgi:hypothetical protein
MPRAPAEARVNARPVPLVARIGRSAGCVAGIVVFVDETDVATAAREDGVEDGVVDFVGTGLVNVTDVIIPDNASSSFIPATPEDGDVR